MAVKLKELLLAYKFVSAGEGWTDGQAWVDRVTGRLLMRSDDEKTSERSWTISTIRRNMQRCRESRVSIWARGW